MRMSIGAILLLAAACGHDAGAPDNRRARAIPAVAVTRLVVSASSGSFDFSTAETPQFVLRTPQEVDATVAGGVLRIRNKAGGRLSIVAPPGLDLVANLRAGAITLTGGWGFVELRASKGDITVRASALAGGDIRTLRGDIACTSGSAPTRNLTCAAVVGDVEMRIPAGFRGAVQLLSGKGGIDVPETGLRLRRDPAGKSVEAFVGEPFTVAENRESPVDKRPAVWARAPRGKVRFRLGGD